MKIVLFGGSGFIGKNLLEQLGKKYPILAPTHHQLDLLDENKIENFLKKSNADVIINCALVGGKRNEENPQKMFYDNLRIFFNIIKNKSYFKKLIHFGSGLEYGRDRHLKKIKEEYFDKKIPKDERGLYKYICSKFIEKIDNVVNLRIFGLYGKYEDFKLRFISNAICKNILGLPIIIDQNVYFDYVYINDFVKIVDFFLNHGDKYKFYNVGSGKRIDLLTVAHKINKIGQNKSKIIIKKRGLNYEYTCKNSRLLGEIKGFKFSNFEETLRELFDYYRGIKNKLMIESLHE